MRSAILFDVDGVLAPIVEHADHATVSGPNQALLVEAAKRYALVACISGRRADAARRIVGVGSIHYVGNHGSEILRRGSTTVEVNEEVASWEPRVKAVVAELLGQRPDRDQRGLWLEDKGPIQALHWRGATSPERAEEVAMQIGEAAKERGFVTHSGRMVLEIRPPLRFDKGGAVRWLLEGSGYSAAVYAGDDLTDLDAFGGLRELVAEEQLDHAVCVAIAGDDAPPAVADAADICLDARSGASQILRELAAA